MIHWPTKFVSFLGNINKRSIFYLRLCQHMSGLFPKKNFVAFQLHGLLRHLFVQDLLIRWLYFKILEIIVIFKNLNFYNDFFRKSRLEIKIRTTALCEISTTNWNFPHFSPCKPGGKKRGKFQFVIEIAHKAVVLILISL